MRARYKIRVEILFADVNHLRTKLFNTKEESLLNKQHIKELLKDTISSRLERKRLNIQEFTETRFLLTNQIEYVNRNSRLEFDPKKKGVADNIISIKFPEVSTSRFENPRNLLPKGNSRREVSTKPSYATIS